MTVVIGTRCAERSSCVRAHALHIIGALFDVASGGVLDVTALRRAYVLALGTIWAVKNGLFGPMCPSTLVLGLVSDARVPALDTTCERVD